ncbi:two-component system CheB/CheR fusion protein [Blastomonas natatoria]|uniref:histidine kinase n=2 Tax=Blastomonas natatoria TaxID=34015 RepID=A0A2V3V764_9SPHN|nr:two-component system CheB/CheR fusion protein [Blastomonas natatoria]
MTRLLDAMPAHTGAAFLLVQHLDPHHTSQLAELLATHTPMRVCEAGEGMAIEADAIYVCPPGRFMAIRFGVLHLSRPQSGDHARLPIDYLVHSLADECGQRSVCIILTGTGDDGSGALPSLHERGGHLIVQDLEEAEYDGMPRAAVMTGLADAVVPLAGIPKALAAILRRMAGAASTLAMPPDGYGTADIRSIIALLLQKVGQDFSAYKHGTLERRIHRRMGLRGLPAGALARYHEELARNQAECEALAEDLLINVTSFFRDPAVFALLESEVLPDVLANLAANQALRVWVVGCSTGEEAYSLAIIMRDVILAAQRDVKLQVFASDVDAQAIAVAREGLYSLSIKDEVPADRLARYFVEEEGGYRVTPALRGSVVFTVQDVLTDPPFSRMDMVSCRNLLIYLKPDAQAKVIGLFHFALRENGVLLLGMAETPGNVSERFAVLHKAERIYRHIARSKPGEPGFPLSFAQSIPRLTAVESKAQVNRQTALANLCRDAVLKSYAPASLLINAQHQCIYSVGPVSRYLRLASGPPSLDLLALAPDDLRGTLRFAISRADREQPLVTTGLCETAAEGMAVFFTITVRFIESDGEPLHLVSFIEQASQVGVTDPAPQHDSQAPLRELERQLESAHADLLAAIQSRDALVLEQKAINDEALSVNEEFQSTNEELLTSKEELQSLNEELIALNSQLQETLDRQRIASDDLQNILYSTNVATLFLDLKLRIRFFTPATKTFFSVIPGDIGRPLADLQSLADDDDLLVDARVVLLQSTTIEREISGPGGTWFVRRIFPYRTHDGRVEGVVITFIDITERRRTAAALDEARRAAEQSNRGKSRFLAVASHDLRQPLQSLALIQEMLRQSVTDPKAQEQIARFGLLLDAMAGMLNCLLDINQIESGVLEVSTVPFTLADLFDRLRNEFTPLTEAQGLALAVVPSSATVLSDARLLEAMLRNLLANAIKYTPPGGRILLGCRHPGAMLRIEVWDSGIGIKQDQLGPIFDEFYQIDNPGSSRERGFGLGLTIVREIGLLLGHPVTVRSRPDKGSVFAVTVPSAPSGDYTEQLAPRLVPTGPTSGCTIALVEDDPGVREALEALLTEAGHTVICARDGPSALALASEGAILPDLVLTDYNLPRGMNGVVVLANLREVLKRHIPGIVLTGDISKDALTEIELADCLLLSKPVTAARLHAAIRKVTPAKGTDHGSSAPHPTRLICILEDNPDMRKAMLSVLGYENWQVTTYPSAEAFLTAESKGADRCLIIDTNLPGMSGIALIEMLRARGDRLPAVLITGTGDIAMAVQAMRSGASDFIERPVSRRDLIDSIKRAVSGTKAGRGLDAAEEAIARKMATLTARQKVVLTMVMAGEPSKNIAADLAISQRTVESHRAQIMQKLGVRTIPDLVRAVLSAGTA